MQATFHIKRERIRHFHVEHYHRLGGGSLHFHSHIEILLMRTGVAEVWIDGARETVYANELALVPSYEAHHFRSVSDRVDCTDLFIPTFLCPDFVEAMRHKRVRSHVIRDAQAMARILDAAEALSSGSLNAIEQTGYIHVVLGTILKHLALKESDAPEEPALPERLLFYINEHYKEDITPTTIAQALGYSANHLAKSFRACFHVGIGRYVNTLRLKNAILLLREKRASITDCALESGFGSLRTFYRVFEEEFGCAPRDYLKQE